MTVRARKKLWKRRLRTYHPELFLMMVLDSDRTLARREAQTRTALNHLARRAARRAHRAGDHEMPRRPYWQRHYKGWKRVRRERAQFRAKALPGVKERG